MSLCLWMRPPERGYDRPGQIDRVESYCKIEVCSLSHQSMSLEQCSVGFTDSMSPDYRLAKGQPINHSPCFRGCHVFPFPYFSIKNTHICFSIMVVTFHRLIVNPLTLNLTLTFIFYDIT